MAFASRNNSNNGGHDNAANLSALQGAMQDFQNQLPSLQAAMDKAMKVANSAAGASAIEMKTVELSGKSMRVTLFSDNSIKIEPVAAISAAEVKAIFDTLTA